MRYYPLTLSAYATFRLADGRSVALVPGDLVGRLRSAALHLHDARISEAHALVSLRGLELRLLALRGRFAVAGRVVDEVVLVPAMTVEFAPGLEVDVVDVVVPDEVIALEGDDLPRQILSGVCSLRVDPRPRLTDRYVGEADAHLWNTGGAWSVRIGVEAARALEAGDSFEIAGHRFRAVSIPVADLGRAATHGGGLRPPLRVEARFDSVQILRPEHPTLVLGGIGARIVSELVGLNGPVHWQVLAQEIWSGEDNIDLLRSRWDVALLRLRRKLRDARLPPELVRADRNGYIELVLEPGDERLDAM